MITVKMVCEENMCAGCMACLETCPKHAIKIVDNLEYYNAFIDSSSCISCAACHNVCQQLHPSMKAKPSQWYQGWTRREKIRGKASSGGIATELINSFLEEGGYVASCTFYSGEFCFRLSSLETTINDYAGSKYVKSNPNGIYKKISNILHNHKVLFIGLPCQVSAIKNFCKNDENLYTVDLICHGSPSPKLLEIFLFQHGDVLEKLENISFRNKSQYQVYKFENNKWIGIEREGVMDCYSIAFLKGLCYTENCYHCCYASLDRVGDLTIGDSWGSELSASEKENGISLILCQTTKGKKLLSNSNIVLRPVDLDKAISNNRQLIEPTKKPEKRENFFQLLEAETEFDDIIRKVYPKTFYKQIVKKILIMLGWFHYGK